jgi:hypothetical protein
MEDPYFEKFLNSLINDLTYCLEEGLNKLPSIREYELKSEKSRTKEDRDNYK